MSSINLQDYQSDRAVSRAAAFLAKIAKVKAKENGEPTAELEARPKLRVIGSSSDSGQYFALSAKVATCALLMIGSATSLSMAAGTQAANNRSTDPVFLYQYNDQSEQTIRARDASLRTDRNLHSSNTLGSDVQKILERLAGPAQEGDVLSTIAIRSLSANFPTEVESAIRAWSTQQHRSFELGVAGYLLNPADWKAQVDQWDQRIAVSAPNPETSPLIRDRLIKQTISDAVERARTIARAELEATGIENPVLAKAVLAERTKQADKAFDDGYARMKDARDPDAMTVGSNTAGLVTAGVAGVIIGAAINSLTNQPRNVQPPPVRYVQPMQVIPQYYQVVPQQSPQQQYYQAPQYYNGAPSVIGGVQPAMQYGNNSYGYTNNGFNNGYVPLTSSRPY